MGGGGCNGAINSLYQDQQLTVFLLSWFSKLTPLGSLWIIHMRSLSVL